MYTYICRVSKARSTFGNDDIVRTMSNAMITPIRDSYS